MTASPPPEPSSRRPLGFDDFIGILVAFLVIGTILFWSLGRKEQGVGISGLLTPSASPVPSPGGVAILPAVQPDGQVAAVAIAPSPTTLSSPEVVLVPPVGAAIVPVPIPGTPDRNVTSFNAAPVPTSSPVASATPTATPAFSDVPSDLWAAPFVAALAERNIISGFQDGTFQPNRPVTRAEFAAMLRSAFAQSPEQRGSVQFKDVPTGSWATAAIDKAYRLGFLQGYPNNVFQPQQQIPRVQALAALTRGLKLSDPANATETLQTYRDADQVPGYATGKIAAATAAGLVVNHPNANILEPNRRATRAEVAAFVYQAMVQANLVEPIASQYIVRP